MDLRVDDIKFLGEINAQKFVDRMNELKTKPIYDYQIIGALGFTGIAQEKWKLILNHFSPLWLLANFDKEDFVSQLVTVKGIGPSTAETIKNEMWFFIKDLTKIIEMENVIPTYGLTKPNSKVIRFTGFRNKGLADELNNMGHDAGEGSVTKGTDILLIPVEGFNSSKIEKAKKYGIPIIPVDDFITNMNDYLS